MTSIYEEYEKEYLITCESIQTNISTLQQVEGKAANDLINTIESQLTQVKGELKQMDMEVRGMDSENRKQYSVKVSQHRNNLSQYEADYNRTKLSTQKSSLIGSKSEEQRQKMFAIPDKMNKQNQLILDATRSVEESIGVGTSIIGELDNNREKIQSIQGNVNTFDGTMQTAEKTVNSMQKRANREKCIIC